MYLAIDVGGTKTLFAVFSKSGEKLSDQRIPTPKLYEDFIKSAENIIKNELAQYTFSACCCALPGRLDREKGIGIRFGNLTWQKVPVRDDLNNLLGDIPVYIENDAKLGGLSEALLVHEWYKKVLYLTIGTGLGGSFIVNGVLEKEFLDMEPGNMMIEYDGKLQGWEDVVSGHAIKLRYGKKASEISDDKIWKEYVKGLALGINELSANFTPDVIIIGGGVGAHFEKFQTFLEEELKKINNPIVPLPTLLKARRPEEAVIYGCYQYIKQQA